MDFGIFFHAGYPDVEINEELFVFDIPRFELAHETIQHELALHRRALLHYTAVICPLSFYWGVMSGIRKAGLRVPEDLSILTFGDRQEAKFYCPRPATLSVQLRDQAFKALELVRWRTENPAAPVRTIQISTEWIEGETLSVASRRSG